MRSVKCHLDSADFANKMMKMRQWFDHHRSQVVDFEYNYLGDNVIIAQLDFADDGEAYDFAAEFDGETTVG